MCRSVGGRYAAFENRIKKFPKTGSFSCPENRSETDVSARPPPPSRIVLTQTESRAGPEFGRLHEHGAHVVPAGRVPDQCETIAAERRRLADVQPLHAHAPALQHEMSVRLAGVAIVVCKDDTSVVTFGPSPGRRRHVNL